MRTKFSQPINNCIDRQKTKLFVVSRQPFHSQKIVFNFKMARNFLTVLLEMVGFLDNQVPQFHFIIALRKTSEGVHRSILVCTVVEFYWPIVNYWSIPGQADRQNPPSLNQLKVHYLAFQAKF